MAVSIPDATLGAFTSSSAFGTCLGSSGMHPETNTFNGDLDEIVVLERALLPEKIAAINAAGSAGSQYLIQSATNLSGQALWTPAYNLVLTNSGQWFDWTNRGEPLRFFRAKEQ